MRKPIKIELTLLNVYIVIHGFNFALDISDKTCLANLNSRFLWGFKVQFESNISLHSLINILSRLSRLFSGEMNGVTQGRKMNI